MLHKEKGSLIYHSSKFIYTIYFTTYKLLCQPKTINKNTKKGNKKTPKKFRTFKKQKKKSREQNSLQKFFYQTARVTFPERKQRVQTLTDFGVPFTIALTFLTLGFHVLFDLLCEWLTLIPNTTPLPQISHFAMIYTPPILLSIIKT